VTVDCSQRFISSYFCSIVELGNGESEKGMEMEEGNEESGKAMGNQERNGNVKYGMWNGERGIFKSGNL